MADDKKISQLVELTALDGEELLVVRKGSGNNSVSVNLLKSNIRSGMVAQQPGKGLSANDYTNEEKFKLSALPANAELTASLAAKQDAIVASEDIVPQSGGKLTLTQQAKMALFVDMWNDACGSFGGYKPEQAPDAEHPYLLNELWLTYEEAVEVYLDGTFDSLASAGKRFIHRTNLPITAFHSQSTIEQSFNSTLFVFDVEVANVASLNSSFYFSAYPISVYHKPFGYAKLRKIIGVIDLHFARSQINWFVGAVNLEEVRIARLAWSINLGSCSKLSLESFTYMIAEALGDAGNGHSRLITVHPIVYAKLTDESNTEWNAVLTAAAEKNITFATI